VLVANNFIACLSSAGKVRDNKICQSKGTLEKLCAKLVEHLDLELGTNCPTLRYHCIWDIPRSASLSTRRKCHAHGVWQSYNLKAEVNLKAAFRAGQLRPRNFAVTINGDAITAIYSKVQATERSGIDDDRFCQVQYALQQRHLRYSCCTCPDAVQLDLCKHQSAVLMLLYPRQEACKTMLKMLGTLPGKWKEVAILSVQNPCTCITPAVHA
jgi:hypothetical protein